jgi:hypothetical protein
LTLPARVSSSLCGIISRISNQGRVLEHGRTGRHAADIATRVPWKRVGGDCEVLLNAGG